MSELAREIEKWYLDNKRDLPWRNTQNPYYIWLSEIILQQTRVNQGLNYYLKFIELFPTVFHLSEASEDEVLKAWEGLGYYSRARNLHNSAKVIVNTYNGVFPREYHQIIDLKGVGEYTAAAIASFAYNLPYPVIDGNVMRVISRYFGILEPIDTKEGKNTIKKALNSVFNSKNPALFNQAIMEFGALQCVPVSPSCASCILSISCEARIQKRVQDLPVKSKKVNIKVRHFYYLISNENNNVFIKKREDSDIWKGLYQFPLIESDIALSENNLKEQAYTNLNANVLYVKKSIKHILTHQHIYIYFVIVDFESSPSDFVNISRNNINDFPFPIALANFIKKYFKKVN